MKGEEEKLEKSLLMSTEAGLCHATPGQEGYNVVAADISQLTTQLKQQGHTPLNVSDCCRVCTLWQKRDPYTNTPPHPTGFSVRYSLEIGRLLSVTANQAHVWFIPCCFEMVSISINSVKLCTCRTRNFGLPIHSELENNVVGAYVGAPVDELQRQKSKCLVELVLCRKC